MLSQKCPKCGELGQFYIDDDGTSRAEACLSCGYRKELPNVKRLVYVAVLQPVKDGAKC